MLGQRIPSIQLESTSGGLTDIWSLLQKPTVLFIYPRAGSPLEPNTNQELWNRTPGARGCTPQSCGFRNLYSEFQAPIVQKEFVKRNHAEDVLSWLKDKKESNLNTPSQRFPDWKKIYEGQSVESMPWFNSNLDEDVFSELKKRKITQGSFLDLGAGTLIALS